MVEVIQQKNDGCFSYKMGSYSWIKVKLYYSYRFQSKMPKLERKKIIQFVSGI